MVRCDVRDPLDEKDMFEPLKRSPVCLDSEMEALQHKCNVLDMFNGIISRVSCRDASHEWNLMTLRCCTSISLMNSVIS